MVKIKICGLTRMCDIEAVNELLPDYIGFVFAESSREITPEQAFKLREKLHAGITAVGVFVNAKIEHIVSLTESRTIDMIQLHGTEDEEYIARIKSLTGKTVIKAVSVQNKGDVQKWDSTVSDYLLLDHKNGGTGETFDWNMIGEVNKPYFLAGGLNTGNVGTAVKRTSPFAVDVSSGVEINGLKDYEKIKNFIRMVRYGK